MRTKAAMMPAQDAIVMEQMSYPAFDEEEAHDQGVASPALLILLTRRIGRADNMDSIDYTYIPG